MSSFRFRVAEVPLAILTSLWKFFASVRLTVVVLLSLAATSIIGTLIPQNEAPEAYLRAFGPDGYRWLNALGVFDMYHAWWFELLLLLLVANIVVCSVDRLRSTWRIIFTRRPNYRPDRFKASRIQTEFQTKTAPSALAASIEEQLRIRFQRVTTIAGDAGEQMICAERGRLSRLGVYTVHLSVVLLIIGGLIGALLGFEGYVNIPEGETIDAVTLRSGGDLRRLPFAIRCDDFDLSFYPTGAPKEYRSRISLLREGRVILERDIIVNDPVRFEGINIFQSSYGKLPPPMPAEGAAPPQRLTVQIVSRESGRAYREQAAIGERLDLPEGLGTLHLDGYLPMAEFMGQPLGPAVQATLTHPDEAPVKVVLPLRFAAFDKMRRGRVFLSVADGAPAVERYYTGLQVTRDPGVGVVYVGFLIMILGCIVTFFIAHQQVCVAVSPRRGGARVTVYGITSRNKMAMQRRIDALARRLAAVETPVAAARSGATGS